MADVIPYPIVVRIRSLDGFKSMGLLSPASIWRLQALAVRYALTSPPEEHDGVPDLS